MEQRHNSFSFKKPSSGEQHSNKVQQFQDLMGPSRLSAGNNQPLTSSVSASPNHLSLSSSVGRNSLESLATTPTASNAIAYSLFRRKSGIAGVSGSDCALLPQSPYATADNTSNDESAFPDEFDAFYDYALNSDEIQVIERTFQLVKGSGEDIANSGIQRYFLLIDF